ncbi:MAG: hypothetical protein IJJ40_05145 [Clostridia bacterium]|nr:hypothetical protein [Clostridia bacterium]
MPRATHIILQKYEALKQSIKDDALSERTTDCIIEAFREARLYLQGYAVLPLVYDGQGKEYFAFQNTQNGKISRAVNRSLFLSFDNTVADVFLQNVKAREITNQTSEEITKACYTIAISFCCSIDMLKDNDQKTPGTFFEYFIGHLMAVQLNVLPSNQLDVLNMDMRATLPTDFIFDLGENRPKFHVPVKTSTRERVVQVWAHQRVLDGVYGAGRFLGLLSCLSETKVNHQNNVVTEICLPDQWRVYQLFIAQMKRIYYLDVPQKYDNLNRVFPPIHVKPFGDFFFEAEVLSN